MFTIGNLEDILPPNSIDFAGGIPRLNLNELTGDVLDLDSSVVEIMGRLLQALYEQTQSLNAQRASQNPPLEPIDFVGKTIRTSARGNPVHEFKISIEVAALVSFDGAIDPAA